MRKKEENVTYKIHSDSKMYKDMIAYKFPLYIKQKFRYLL